MKVEVHMGYLERQTRVNTRHNSTKSSVRTVLLADQVRAANELSKEHVNPHRRVVSFCNFVTIWHVSRETDSSTEDDDDESDELEENREVKVAKSNRWLRLLQLSLSSRQEQSRGDYD